VSVLPKKLPLIAAALSMVLISGCTRIRAHQGYIADTILIDAIQAGVDNRESVEKTLGRPTFISQFGQQDWYYISRETKQLAFSTPSAATQMVLRVRFDAAGNVAGVDKAGMEKIAKVKPTGDKTPTMGRDRNFLEDLFGNIGAVGAAGKGTQDGGTPNGG
jgi:outer membrane protein assembly factor BamE (lipoprotein component of BamABCDE complex)